MQYKGVWTNKGLEKLAAFASGGKAVSFAQVAIGDGGGAIPEPSAAVTALAGEVWRGAINTVSQNAENTSSVLVEIVIPYNVGGFFIREWGIYDDEGDLLVYGNHAEFYKALLAEGTGAEHRELIELPITNEGAVQITVSYESLASVDFVKSQIQVVLQKLSDHENDPNAHEELFSNVQEQIENSSNLKTGDLLISSRKSVPGCFLCDSSAVGRKTYTDLFDEIGTTYGEGDGSTTFNLPDFRGRFIQGANGDLGSIKEAGLPNILGSFNAQITDGLTTPSSSGALYHAGQGSNGFFGAGTGYRIQFDASRSNPIYGKSDTVQPPAITMNVFIKY